MIQFVVGILIGFGVCFIFFTSKDPDVATERWQSLEPIPKDLFVKLKPKQIFQFRSFEDINRILTIKAVK